MKRGGMFERDCLVVAEVAQAHDGSLNAAHAYIDAIAGTGAGAVKFQTHLAEAESTPAEPWRVPPRWKKESRYEYWQRMEFTPDQWRGLKEHADERGLLFLSSPFSLEAAKLLDPLVPAWKIASGEVTNAPMLDFICATRKPAMLSTGMSDLDELDRLVERLTGDIQSDELVILQCTSIYPCLPEDVGLNLLKKYHKRYFCKVGLSDHSGTPYPGILAASKGASVVEVHVKLSEYDQNFDAAASLTIDQLKFLVEGVRWAVAMRSNPVDKDKAAEALKETRAIFEKKIVTNTTLAPGTILTGDMLEFKKTTKGIPASEVDRLVGRTLINWVVPGYPISEIDFI